MKIITIAGVTYPSISAAARAFGIPDQALRKRIAAGWSDERLSERLASSGRPRINDEARQIRVAFSLTVEEVAEVAAWFERVAPGLNRTEAILALVRGELDL